MHLAYKDPRFLSFETIEPRKKMIIFKYDYYRIVEFIGETLSEMDKSLLKKKKKKKKIILIIFFFLFLFNFIEGIDFGIIIII